MSPSRQNTLSKYVTFLISNKVRVASQPGRPTGWMIPVTRSLSVWGEGSSPERAEFTKFDSAVFVRNLWVDMESLGPLTVVSDEELVEGTSRLRDVLVLYGVKNAYDDYCLSRELQSRPGVRPLRLPSCDGTESRNEHEDDGDHHYPGSTLVGMRRRGELTEQPETEQISSTEQSVWQRIWSSWQLD